MKLHERLKSFRASLGKSQKEMAEAMNVAVMTWQQYESGKTDIKGKILEKLLEMGANPHWLLTGKGAMSEEATLETSTDVSLSFIALQHRAPNESIYYLPIFNTISSLSHAHDPSHVSETSYLPIPRMVLKERFRITHENITALYMSGDSMTPTLRSDNLVIVDLSCQALETDGVYAYAYREDGYINRLQKMGGKISVSYDNPIYKGWTIEDIDDKRLRIFGRVCGIIRAQRV